MVEALAVTTVVAAVVVEWAANVDAETRLEEVAVEVLGKAAAAFLSEVCFPSPRRILPL